MQNKLFDIPPIRIKRPDFNSINFGEAYKEMAEEILEWMNDDNVELEDIISDLKECFSPQGIKMSDGYELAKELDRDCGYDVNTELVNILDGFSHKLYMECQKFEKKWVIDCNITPKHSIGDKVHISRKGKIYEGEISAINNEVAEYTICVPELGHVREGVGTHGAIEHFENIEEDFFDKKHWEKNDPTT